MYSVGNFFRRELEPLVHAAWGGLNWSSFLVKGPGHHQTLSVLFASFATIRPDVPARAGTASDFVDDPVSVGVTSKGAAPAAAWNRNAIKSACERKRAGHWLPYCLHRGPGNTIVPSPPLPQLLLRLLSQWHSVARDTSFTALAAHPSYIKAGKDIFPLPDWLLVLIVVGRWSHVSLRRGTGQQWPLSWYQLGANPRDLMRSVPHRNLAQCQSSQPLSSRTNQQWRRHQQREGGQQRRMRRQTHGLFHIMNLGTHQGQEKAPLIAETKKKKRYSTKKTRTPRSMWNRQRREGDVRQRYADNETDLKSGTIDAQAGSQWYHYCGYARKTMMFLESQTKAWKRDRKHT